MKNQEAMREEGVKKVGLREAMPGAAALVDELRGLFGSAWVDAALREGLRLQREHARRVAQQGPGPADAWLQAQRSAQPALRVCDLGAALQADATATAPAWVGALAGNRPAPIANTRR